MATLKGIWVFNDGVADDLDTITPNTFSFNFTSNGNSYTSFVTQYGGEFGMAQIYYDSTLAYGGDMDTSWQNEAYKTINITSEPTDEAFITWLTANATQQASEEEEPTTSVVTVEYDGLVVATIPSGNKATIPIANKKMKTDIVITVPSGSGGGSSGGGESGGGGTVKDSALPIEVSTEAEMTALLTSGEVGGVYKYTGTTGTYENGALYVLEEEEVEDELAGTWVLNNTVGLLNTISVNFESNGQDFVSIDANSEFITYGTSDNVVYAMAEGSWVNQAYKTITITSKLSEVTNGDTLLTWLKANATKQ